MSLRHHRSFLHQCLSLKESWIIFFVLGIIMMNFPFLSIFNKPTDILGLPLLYFYLYAGWLVSITVILLFSRATNSRQNGGEPRQNGEGHP